jgi:hypothetical protein
MVTWLAYNSMQAVMSKESRVTESWRTTTQPEFASYAQPEPDWIVPGTAVRTVPAGIPLFVASGYPHEDGLSAQRTPPLPVAVVAAALVAVVAVALVGESVVMADDDVGVTERDVWDVVIVDDDSDVVGADEAAATKSGSTQ